MSAIEVLFAVCKFVKSHNNKSFIELACSVRIGKIPVSFFFWKELDQYLPNTTEQASSIKYIENLGTPSSIGFRV